MSLTIQRTPTFYWKAALIALAIGVAVLVVFYNSDWVRDTGMKYVNVYLRKVLSMSPFIIGAVVSTMCILLLEISVLGWRKSSLYQLVRPGKTEINDIVLWMIDMSQIGFIMIYIVTYGVFIKLRPLVREVLGLDVQLMKSIASPVLQVILFAVMVDFLAYCLHYIIHHSPSLWAFHKVHHGSDKFVALTVSRVHPVERHFFSDVFYLIPFAIVGVPAQYVAVYAIFRYVVATLQHSRLNWGWGFFGTHVIASPYFHRLHHSKLPEHYDKNLAVTFPIWDHLFGTYCGDKIGIDDVGLNENPYNKRNVVHDFFLSFRETWQTSRDWWKTKLGLSLQSPDRDNLQE